MLLSDAYILICEQDSQRCIQVPDPNPDPSDYNETYTGDLDQEDDGSAPGDGSGNNQGGSGGSQGSTHDQYADETTPADDPESGIKTESYYSSGNTQYTTPRRVNAGFSFAGLPVTGILIGTGVVAAIGTAYLVMKR